MTPPRVVRRRRTGLIAALAAVLFLAGLMGFETRDDAWLLKVAGQPVDLRGRVAVAWQNAWRDCSAVRRYPAQGVTPTPHLADAIEALREFSPPDSRSARVLRVDEWTVQDASPMQDGPGELKSTGAAAPTWFALQAQFDALEAVVVLVRQGAHGAQVVPEGVWSGTTRPWDPAWRIRRFLTQRVDDAPRPLLACLDPLEVFAQPPRPL